MRRRVLVYGLTLALTALTAPACSDDTPDPGVSGSDNGANLDTGGSDEGTSDVPNPDPDVPGPDPDVPEPDVPEDTAEPDTAEPDVVDPDVVDPDVVDPDVVDPDVVDPDVVDPDVVEDAGPDAVADVPVEDVNLDISIDAVGEGVTGDTVTPDVNVPDAVADVPPDISEPDVAPDTGGPDAVPDAGPDVPPDVAPACGGLGEACCDGACDGGLECLAGLCADPVSGCPDNPECPVPPPGVPDVPINLVSGTPPVLAGGTIPNASYDLVSVDIYTDNTFTDLVQQVNISSSGNTYGSLIFDGAGWGLDANLDLYLQLEVFLAGAIDQGFAQGLSGGGCYTTEGATLFSDLLQCGGDPGLPPGAELPTEFGFEVGDASLTVLVIITQDFVIAALPEEYQGLAGLAIAGDLPIILQFTQQ